MWCTTFPTPTFVVFLFASLALTVVLADSSVPSCQVLKEYVGKAKQSGVTVLASFSAGSLEECRARACAQGVGSYAWNTAKSTCEFLTVTVEPTVLASDVYTWGTLKRGSLPSIELPAAIGCRQLIPSDGRFSYAFYRPLLEFFNLTCMQLCQAAGYSYSTVYANYSRACLCGDSISGMSLCTGAQTTGSLASWIVYTGLAPFSCASDMPSVTINSVQYTTSSVSDLTASISINFTTSEGDHSLICLPKSLTVDAGGAANSDSAASPWVWSTSNAQRNFGAVITATKRQSTPIRVALNFWRPYQDSVMTKETTCIPLGPSISAKPELLLTPFNASYGLLAINNKAKTFVVGWGCPTANPEVIIDLINKQLSNVNVSVPYNLSVAVPAPMGPWHLSIVVKTPGLGEFVMGSDNISLTMPVLYEPAADLPIQIVEGGWNEVKFNATRSLENINRNGLKVFLSRNGGTFMTCSNALACNITLPGTYEWYIQMTTIFASSTVIARSPSRKFTVTYANSNNSLCGNGIVNTGEQCDQVGGGCAANCMCEQGYVNVPSQNQTDPCQAVCSSKGCIVCSAPEVCWNCQPDYDNPSAGCTFCSDSSLIYPNCTAKNVPNTTNLQCGMINSQSQCKGSTANCTWCSILNECVSDPSVCSVCTSFSSTTCSAASVFNCSWCSLENKCKGANACTNSCSTVNDEWACTQIWGCTWDAEGCVDYAVSSCLKLTDSDSCEQGNCSWCPDGNICLSSADECVPCLAATDQSSCTTALAGCSWCSSLNKCFASADLREFCIECQYLHEDDCVEGYFPQCSWCATQGRCGMSTALDGMSCNCSVLDENSCSKSSCSWCPTTEECLSPEETCPKCSSLSHYACESTVCSVCETTQSCMAISVKASSCFECQDLLISTCSRYSACEVCGGGCVSKSSSCENTTSTKHSSSDTTWILVGVFSAAGACGLFGAVIVGALFARKKKAESGVSNARARSSTFKRGSVALSELQEVEMSDTGLTVDTHQLEWKDPLEIDKEIIGSFTITNKGKESAHVKVATPDAVDDFSVSLSDIDFKLSAGSSKEVSLALTPHASTAIAFVLAICKGDSKYFFVKVKAGTVPSPKLSWNDIEIKETVGKGAFGVVYHATWRGQEVAVKELIAIDLVMEIKAELEREVNMMQALRSPFLICFFGTTVSATRTAIVMEFSKLGSLSSIIKKQELPMSLKIKIAYDCARGMNVLHENCILHRDLKTDNLLVFSLSETAEVRVKLSDFGSSRSVVDERAHKYTKAVGTPIYMAPEILDNHEYNMKADVYSYAVLLLHLVSQQEPYTEFLTPFAITAFVSGGKRLPIPDSPLASLNAKCWAHTPEDRPDFPTICKELHALAEPLS